MNALSKFWNFLKQDNWKSWIVSIILMVLLIKLVLFPLMHLITGTPLPLVIVESCSMYHSGNFNDFWNEQGVWYERQGINKSEFAKYPMKNGINKGDVILVWGRTNISLGDIIIFNAGSKYPLIHRVVSLNPLATKGDHNQNQITSSSNNLNIDETNINLENLVGEAKIRVIPYVGWIKLIFFEPLKPKDQRGLCH